MKIPSAVPVRDRSGRVRLGILLLAATGLLMSHESAQAGDDELLNLSLDQLLQVEVLESAAKYPISLDDAPAVMEVITAEEIRDLAPRDLGDLLAQLPSLVVQNDHINERLTVRGTSIPGDETTRILVLVDGHVLQEHWNGTSPLHALNGIGPSQIKRLEVVRGPGSVIFGSSALWATVNIVTQDGGDLKGARWQGSFEPVSRTVQWAGSWGQHRRDSDLAVHLLQIRSRGAQLRFDEGEGAYDGASDAEEAAAARVRWHWKNATLALAHSDRTDHVPHEWYQSMRARNENRYREMTTQAELALHTRPWRDHELRLRAFADAYRGRWFTVYADTLSRQGLGFFLDDGKDRNAGAEATYVLVQGDRLRGAMGASARWLEVEQHSGQRTADESDWTGDGDVVPPEARVHRFSVLNAYATAQVRVTGRVQTFGGLHFDRTSGEQRLTPRAGFIVKGGHGVRLRAMMGEGFRTPSIYERYYTDGFLYIANPKLTPETVRTLEVSLSKTLAGANRADGALAPTLTLTTYRNQLESLVSLVEVPRAATAFSRDAAYADTLMQFANLGAIRAQGVEASAQHLAWGRWKGSAHVSRQSVRDEQGRGAPNAPTWTGGLRATRSWGPWLTGIEGRYIGNRKSYAGRELDGFMTLHLSLGWRQLDGRAEARLRIDNLLDTAGQVALYQPDFAPLETVPIDGRRVTAQFTARF